MSQKNKNKQKPINCPCDPIFGGLERDSGQTGGALNYYLSEREKRIQLLLINHIAFAFVDCSQFNMSKKCVWAYLGSARLIYYTGKC